MSSDKDTVIRKKKNRGKKEKKIKAIHNVIAHCHLTDAQRVHLKLSPSQITPVLLMSMISSEIFLWSVWVSCVLSQILVHPQPSCQRDNMRSKNSFTQYKHCSSTTKTLVLSTIFSFSPRPSTMPDTMKKMNSSAAEIRKMLNVFENLGICFSNNAIDHP